MVKYLVKKKRIKVIRSNNSSTFETFFISASVIFNEKHLLCKEYIMGLRLMYLILGRG